MVSDKKMIELVDILKASGKVRFDNDFCESIGLLKQNLSRIRSGDAHFTPDHIRNACKEYKVNANWVLGLEDNIYRKA